MAHDPRARAVAALSRRLPASVDYPDEWADGMLRHMERTEGLSVVDADRLAALEDRVEALEGLLACYRVGKQPTEALHRKLDKSRAALAASTPKEPSA